MRDFDRRRVLRGLLNGGAVTVGLPLLNCFLNGSGDALATGEKLPVRFGTFFWGCGINSQIFAPKKTGKDFEFPEEIKALAPLRDYINVLTNAAAFTDNSPKMCHFTGWAVARTGIAPASRTLGGETYDVTIANRISRTRRFKTLTANAAFDARLSMSYEDPNTPNPPEYSPVLFYARLFGPDFPDPNAKDFKLSPRVMARKSVLSAVMEDMGGLNSKIGAEDRVRLDQYFTGLRHLEQQRDADVKMGNESTLVEGRNKMMAELLAMAVACDQTRVINMAYAEAQANTTRAGYEKPHHTATHEELIDPLLGYQPNASWFTRRCMEGFADFARAFANIKEGDGTVLDNMLIVADTDHSRAQLHQLDNLALLTAGRAGGKVKTGIHVNMDGKTIARMGYTVQRVMDVEIASFGDRSNRTSSEIGEILA
jgi:hypothetical protein